MSGYSKSNDIFFQRFDSAKNTLGSQTRVNSVINGNQDISAITELDGVGLHGRPKTVMSPTFMTHLTKSWICNPSILLLLVHRRIQIAKLADGNFVLAWEEVNTSSSDYGIYGQIFNSSGNKVGTISNR